MRCVACVSPRGNPPSPRAERTVGTPWNRPQAPHRPRARPDRPRETAAVAAATAGLRPAGLRAPSAGPPPAPGARRAGGGGSFWTAPPLRCQGQQWTGLQEEAKGSLGGMRGMRDGLGISLSLSWRAPMYGVLHAKLALLTRRKSVPQAVEGRRDSPLYSLEEAKGPLPGWREWDGGGKGMALCWALRGRRRSLGGGPSLWAASCSCPLACRKTEGGAASPWTGVLSGGLTAGASRHP